jgi:AcrR family transcriptional regulator
VARTGRRPGASGSREQILAAARSHFAAEGYDGATIRGIAGAAGVDPALVLHYFDSKERLFIAAMEFPADPAEFVPQLIAPGTEGLGERVATFLLDLWEGPGGRPFIALLRSAAANEQAAQMLRQFIEREVLGRVAASLELDQPKLRAALAGSHLVGLALMRYIIKLEPIASADRRVLAREVGAAIQRYFAPAKLDSPGR